MLLLFGTRPAMTVLLVVTYVCGRCGTNAEQRVVQQVTKFTLFFVPLFSFARSWFVECSHCGAETPLTAQQARNSVSWASTHA